MNLNSTALVRVETVCRRIPLVANLATSARIMKGIALPCLLLSTAFPLAGEPPLPPGLRYLPAAYSPSAEDDTPPLPPGLGLRPAAANDDIPPLPPGLRDLTESTIEAERGERVPHGLPFDIHGFLETRVGPRLFDDAVQSKDFTIAETRLQLRTSWITNHFELDAAYDAFLDGVDEGIHGDLRQLRLSFSLFPWMDVRAGRQVLTWGTGDLLFVNDLFPKDLQSFLIGRDDEYLKAPSDAIRLGFFFDAANIDIVYTPRFEPDRYITGKRLSYWNPLFGQSSGEDFRVRTIEPDRTFTNDEWAWRIYRTVRAAEVALYGYHGYWKSPAGQDL